MRLKDKPNNTIIMTREILSAFKGKNDIIHIKEKYGREAWKTQPSSFKEDAKILGGYSLNVINAPKKHVLFVFNIDGKEVKRYYICRRLWERSQFEIAYFAEGLLYYDAYNSLSEEWIPCIDINDNICKIKEGFESITILLNHKWSVINREGKTLVPPGKYDYIDAFDACGLARVKLDAKEDFINPEKSTQNRWGIIDLQGEEILKLEYSSIWNFTGKGRKTARVLKEYTVEEADGSISDWGVWEYEFDLYTHKLIDIDAQRLERESEINNYTVWDSLEDALEGDLSNYGNID